MLLGIYGLKLSAKDRKNVLLKQVRLKMLKMALFYEWMLKLILSEPQTALAEQLMVAFISTVGSKPLARAPQLSTYKPEITGITHSTCQSAAFTALLQ